MAEYDGEIRINTKINTKDVSSQMMQLENRMQKTAQKAQQLESQMRKLEQQKIPTDEFGEIQKQIENAEHRLAALNDRMTKFLETGGNADSKTFKNMQYDAAELENTLEYARGEMQALKEAGGAYVDPRVTQEYQQLSQQLRNTNADYSVLSRKQEELAAKEAKAGNTGKKSFNGVKDAINGMKKSLSGVASTLGKAKNSIAKFGSVAKSAFQNVASHSKKSGGLLSNFGTRIRGLALSLLVFNWISKGFNAMIDSMKAGIQNYAKYSGTFNRTMSDFKSSVANLKNAVGVAVTPLLNALLPALTTICNWLTRAANAANQLFSALTGRSTWSKAKKQQVDYAKSLDNTSKAAKKAKGALQGFDELNVINSNDSSSGGSGSGGGGVSYEEQPISDKFKRIKDILKGDDWTEIGKIIADKLNEAMQSIPWDKIQTEAEKAGKRIGTLINGFVAEFDWGLLGYTIGQGINTALIFANTFFTTVDWTSLGRGLATGINGAVRTIDWKLLGFTISNGLNASIDAAYGFVQNLKWGLIGSSIGEALTTAIRNFEWAKTGETLGTVVTGIFTTLDQLIKNTDWRSLGSGIVSSIGGFFSTLDWGVIGSSLSSAISGLLQSLSGAIEQVDWFGLPRYIVTSIGDFLTGFDWSSVASSVGELLGQALKGGIENTLGLWDLLADAWGGISDYFKGYIDDAGGNIILGLYNGIKDALANAGQWIKDNIFTPFMEGFKTAFGIHSPSTVMKEMGGYIIDGLKLGLTGIWDKVSGVVDKFKQNIGAAFLSVKTNAIIIFTAMKDRVKGIFNGMWNGIKGVINSILGGAEKMANGMSSGINGMIGALNGLKFDVPDWVPGLGGKKFSLNIPTIGTITIPRLANGGITTGSTLANIGEAGREAVLPLENNLSYLEPLANMIASKMEGVQTVRIVPDESGIFKVVRDEASSYYRRTGNPAFDF